MEEIERSETVTVNRTSHAWFMFWVFVLYCIVFDTLGVSSLYHTLITTYNTTVKYDICIGVGINETRCAVIGIPVNAFTRNAPIPVTITPNYTK